MDIKSLYRQVILDHASNPRNNASIDIEKGYIKKRGYNPSCGDDVIIFLKTKDNKIIDIKHRSVGCSICTASTSIATAEVNGLDFKDAEKKIITFLNMIKNEEFNKEDLSNEVLALEGVNEFPARVKCASLAWVTILEMLKEEN